MLQRVYGIVAKDQAELDAIIAREEEARKRDHRILGKQLELFTITDSVGPGLVHWLPKGARIRVAIEEYWRKKHYDAGYEIVYTPHVGRSNLWQTSGHLGFYKEGMFPCMKVQEGAGDDSYVEEYYVKPMNCPFHIQIYQAKKRSYRDLPMRLAELGTVYRYEKDGVRHGLFRVRGFTQDDAHIFCRPDQVKDEFLRVMDIIMIIFKALKFEKFEAQISLRDKVNREKYIGSEENWERAESAIIEACREKGLPAVIEYGEAAFYGPKLDFMVKDALGRRWQLGTIQVDYNLPERFQLEYTGSDNLKHRPVMIHRAPFGSMERFTAVLIEHTAGHFPLWLTPDQVAILPISEKFNDYAEEVRTLLEAADVRAIVDDRNEKIGRKIRDNEMKHIPYLLIVGEKEAAEGLVAVRKQGEGDQGVMSIADFAKKVNDEVAQMTNV
jgi:threonyl-tRNA synthetase